jgi:hypothetical protein
MIEHVLDLAEARWILQVLGLEPAPDSPLRDALSAVPEVPKGSPAEDKVIQGLQGRGLVTRAGAPNPFASAALVWLASPEKVWCLALFGPGGAEAVHLAFREGSAVECRRELGGLRLRYPLPEEDAAAWLKLRAEGGGHAG